MLAASHDSQIFLNPHITTAVSLSEASQQFHCHYSSVLIIIHISILSDNPESTPNHHICSLLQSSLPLPLTTRYLQKPQEQMTSDAEFIAAFCEVTNSSEEVARYYRVVRRYRDYQQAIDRYFEDGMTPDLTPSQRQELERALINEGGVPPPPGSGQGQNASSSSSPSSLSGLLPRPPRLLDDLSLISSDDLSLTRSRDSSSSSSSDDPLVDGDLALDGLTRLLSELARLHGLDDSSSSSSESSPTSAPQEPEPQRETPEWRGAPLRLPVFTKPKEANIGSYRSEKVPARKKKGVTLRVVVFQDGIEYNNKFYKNDTSEAQKFLKGVESGLLEIGGPDVVDVCVVDRRDTKYSK